MINWTISPQDFDLVIRIAKRYEREHGRLDPQAWKGLIMDLNACHSNGCPLDLPSLLVGNMEDFGHDVGGIQKYIDRETGKLTQCFVPRHAKKEV